MSALAKPDDYLGLRCANCDGRILAVKDSRPSRNAVRRRRRCVNCGQRFTTFEIFQSDDERLRKALDHYDAWAALPEAQRELIVAMVNALSPKFAAPPLLIAGPPTHAGQLALDAALVGGGDEEAPYG